MANGRISAKQVMVDDDKIGFGGPLAHATVIAAAVALGTLSWVLVERPALRRKRSTIHRVGD